MPGKEQDRSVSTESSKTIICSELLLWYILIPCFSWPCLVWASVDPFEVSLEPDN